jgi:hypothetical protein
VSRRLSAAAVVAALALLVSLAHAPAAEARRQAGEPLEIRGIVTDAEGRPLDRVRVVFEASRAVFSLREFRPVLRDTARVAAETDADTVATLAADALQQARLDLLVALGRFPR